MTTFIFDELTGFPTVMATGRAKRSDQTGAVSGKGNSSSGVAANVDRFARGNEHLTPAAVYQDSDDWNVRVFPNKYPIVEDHEIIVHSPDAAMDIEDLPHEQNVRIIRAFLNRASFYNSREKEIMIFNNRGGKAGASIMHPHSQIIALKGFPGIVEHEKSHALEYYNEHTSCYWCDKIKAEQAYQKRIVVETNHFLLVVPEACRWSYEMTILPKEHKPNFGFINEMEINDLADILASALRAYNCLFDRPDRNFWIHTMRYEPYHWHIGFIPHIKVFGGLELGAGIWVNDRATPEVAAAELRGCIDKNLSSVASAA